MSFMVKIHGPEEVRRIRENTAAKVRGANNRKTSVKNYFVLYFSPRKGTLTDAGDGEGRCVCVCGWGGGEKALSTNIL